MVFLQTHNKWFRKVLLVFLMGMTRLALAQNTFDLYYGYAALSTLKNETTINVKYSPAGFDYGRHLKSWDVYIGMTSQFAQISYQVNNVDKKGVFYTGGFHISQVFYRSKHFGILGSLALLPYSVIAVGSEANFTVNDTRVTHKSVTTFTGFQGYNLRIGAFLPTKNKSRYRVGASLEYMGQKYTKKTIRTVSSNSDLSPETSKETSTSNDSLSSLSTLLFIGLII
jgi:hypothetical protein